MVLWSGAVVVDSVEHGLLSGVGAISMLCSSERGDDCMWW